MLRAVTRQVILVVDDDEAVREMLGEALRDEAFDVVEAADGRGAIEVLSEQSVDLLVLDLSLPDQSGIEVLRWVRGRGQLPVIVVSGRSEESDRVVGLELGADDYVVKPCSLREFVARVRSVLRRADRSSPAQRWTFGDLVIDAQLREVFLNGRPVRLTVREFDLLSFLAATPRRVVVRDELLREVWKSDPRWQSDATITEHVRRLRTKVEVDASNPRHVLTVRGVGYRFEP
jgi:two-component system, OmpR family, phosphate regulon response regulator PhoB